VGLSPRPPLSLCRLLVSTDAAFFFWMAPSLDPEGVLSDTVPSLVGSRRELRFFRSMMRSREQVVPTPFVLFFLGNVCPGFLHHPLLLLIQHIFLT